MPNGQIKSYIAIEESGMISPSDQSRDVYFTRWNVEGGSEWLAKGVKVTYELSDVDGSPRATTVKRRT